MNKNLVIIILVLLAITLYLCYNVESFADANIVNGEIESTVVNTIQALKAQVDQLASDEILWEKRPIKVVELLKILKSELTDCGVKDLEITEKDLNFADSRIKFVKFLPVTSLIGKLTYDSIRCFVQKIDRNNLVSWIKEEVSIPKYLLPKNIVIVNDILYQTSPYGVLKYKISSLSKFKGNNALNASIEASLLNDYNFYNRSTDIIFPFQGAIIQKVGSQYKDLRTDESYEIRRLLDRVDLMNSRVIKELNLKEISSKFEDKPAQEVLSETVQESKVSQELKDEVTNQVINNEELKEVLIRISQSQNLPEIRTDANSLLAKLVAKRADQVTSESTEAKTNTPAPAIKQSFSNTYESFGVIGLIDNVPVTGKDALGIAQQVIQEVIADVGDKKEIKKIFGEVNEAQLNQDVIFVSEYNGINYLFTPSEVKPYSKWAIDVNTLLSSSRTSIKTVVPHYFMEGQEFKTRLILILEDDFYISIQNDEMEAPKDWVSEFGFSFSSNLPEVYTCNENKTILEQMVRANVIPDSRRKEILAKLKCQ